MSFCVQDNDLATLYGLTVKRLNENVRRNRERFPEDFLFQLAAEMAKVLRSQNATSRSSHGGRSYLRYTFTEDGAIMAATVLISSRAVEVSVFVARAFVKFRQLALTHKELAAKLDQLNRKWPATTMQFAIGAENRIYSIIGRCLMSP